MKKDQRDGGSEGKEFGARAEKTRRLNKINPKASTFFGKDKGGKERSSKIQ